MVGCHESGGTLIFTEERSLMIGLTAAHFPGDWSRTPRLNGNGSEAILGLFQEQQN
jgi:hypothetical protein